MDAPQPPQPPQRYRNGSTVDPAAYDKLEASFDEFVAAHCSRGPAAATNGRNFLAAFARFCHRDTERQRALLRAWDAVSGFIKDRFEIRDPFALNWTIRGVSLTSWPAPVPGSASAASYLY